jgi:hypothetical protein
MIINNEKFCKKVVTIPQFIGTCWFNAILMALLYSQNSRKLLLHDNIYKKSKENNDLYKIINDILLDNYISRKKAMKYYDKLRPETILKDYLKSIIDEEKINIILKHGWMTDIYLPRFTEIIGKSCLTLDEYKGDFYINAIKSIDVNVILKSDNTNIYEVSLNDKFKDMLNEIREINKGNLENPDYLYVNLNKNKDSYVLYDIYFKFLEKKIKKLDKIKNKKNQFKGLNDLEDIIEFNGDRYILDSCILTNYNKFEKGNHAIAGISCKNNRYVYNGWIRTTADPSIVDKNLFKTDNMPCELMKFNWDVNNPNNKFCLNHNECGLRNISKSTDKDLCFSFGKGIRTLIYVKMNKDYKSLDIKVPKERSGNTCPKPRRPVNDKCEEGKEIRINKEGFLCCYKSKKDPKIKNTCLKPRRPVNDKCEEGKEIRINKQGFLCCYKSKKVPKIKNTCPKPRRPIDGKCENGLKMKMNKQNFECCYKK